jgi:hypothetical protein
MRNFYKVIALCVFAGTSTVIGNSATLSQNDFWPLRATDYPLTFLNANQKEVDKDQTDDQILEIMHMSISGFGQTASKGRNHEKKEEGELGDIQGRWNMVGLLYGSTPTGQTEPALLTTASTQTYDDGNTLDHPNYTDVKDQLGHFSVEAKYRKVGVRAKFQGRILNDFVFTVQGGVADMRVTVSAFHDGAKTTPAGSNVDLVDYYGTTTPPSAGGALAIDKATIETYLMDVRDQIFTQMGLDGESWSNSGVEDIDASLSWRHNFHTNQERNDDNWDEFICTPHFTVGGILGIGKERDESKRMSLPFGSNGHHAVYVSSGMSVDFYDTVEFAFQASGTHFFKRKISGMFIPTDERQTGIFPYKTDVDYDPGITWNFSFSMNAYHYSDKLSFYAQYLFTNHTKDTISLVTADTAFKPTVLEKRSNWTVQAANFGFNLDLTPAMTLGIAWQAPIARRAAFKTNTLILSLIGTF